MDDILRNSTVQTVIQAIVNFRTWLYLFAGLGILIALRAMLLARRERARALFGLEREAAGNRLSQALFTLLVMSSLAGAVFLTVNYLTPEAVEVRAESRARAAASATAQVVATLGADQATRRAALPSATQPPSTATPVPSETPTPAPPPTPDINDTCHGEGNPLQTRYVDRQAVNLRRSPEIKPDNLERVLQLHTPLCVYEEIQVQGSVWLRVTVSGIEGYRFMLREFTRE